MPQCPAFGCSNVRGSQNEEGKRIAFFFPIPDPAKSDESTNFARDGFVQLGRTNLTTKDTSFTGIE